MERTIRVAVLMYALWLCPGQQCLGQGVDSLLQEYARFSKNGGDPQSSAAAVERTLAREVPAAVVNTTVCRCQGYKEHLCLCLKAGVKCHCSRTVGSVWAVNESGVATHKTGAKADPRHAVTPTPVTPSTPPVATAPPAAADTKPAITITVAPFHCPPCNAVKAMDWSGFDVTWVTGGAVSAYPEISWKDKRGVKRILTGAYTPSRVRWSWERTQ